MTANTIINIHGAPANIEEVREAERLHLIAKTFGRDWSLQNTFNRWEDASEDFLPGSGWVPMPRDDGDLWRVWLQFERKMEAGG